MEKVENYEEPEQSHEMSERAFTFGDNDFPYDLVRHCKKCGGEERFTRKGKFLDSPLRNRCGREER